MEYRYANNVIIFLPETGMYPYLRTLCSIGRAISHHITLLHCTGQFEMCNMMSTYDEASEERKKKCKACNKLYLRAKKFFNADSIELSDLITNDKLQCMKKIIPSDLFRRLSFSYKGVPVGKIAECDLVQSIKFADIMNISENDKKLYTIYIVKAIIAVEIAEYICKSKPKMILAFNPYAINQVAHYVARENGVPYNEITNKSYKGADYSSFCFSKECIAFNTRDSVEDFYTNASVPLLPNLVRYSWDDAFFRFYKKDGHIFSSAKNVLPETIVQRLKLDKTKKTILAFTSSLDEMICDSVTNEVFDYLSLKKDLFETQVEWIKFLKRYADIHKEVQVVVRTHPREGARQHNRCAENLLLLKETFKERSDNFVIIWSDDPISSYDLIELADLCLVNWSSMGYECARVGIPVISYTRGSYYINSKSFQVAESIDDYEKRIEACLNKAYSFEMLTDAVRYNCWLNHMIFVNCDETIPHDFDFSGKFYKIVSEKAEVIAEICCEKKSARDFNKENWFKKVTDTTERDEAASNLKGISDFFFMVFMSRSNQKISFRLFDVIRRIIYICSFKKIVLGIPTCVCEPKYPRRMLFSDKEKTKLFSCSKRQPYYSLETDNIVVYSYGGKVCRRWSPLLHRLGEIYKAENAKFS